LAPWCALVALMAGCESDPAPPPSAQHTTAPSGASAPEHGAPKHSASPHASVVTSPAPPRPAACRAPSLDDSEPIDARDDAAIADCRSLNTRQANASKTCGEDGSAPALALDRLDEAAAPLDATTLQRIRTIARRGKAEGRRLNTFGLVGDSMTVSHHFLGAFGGERGKVEIAPDVQARLALKSADGHSVIEHYAASVAMTLQGKTRTSFVAPRAAKVGARASWALEGGRLAPMEVMLRDLSPAVAVVLYGGNDGAALVAPPDKVADIFEQHLVAIIDRLENAGVVPILSTAARHGDQPGVPDCGGRDETTNWRVAVQTNAVSVRAAEIACRRKLPLVDLRHALDGIVNQGLGPDGVHPSVYRNSGGVLTGRGLQCGYNVRNYITLRMLARVYDAIAPVYGTTVSPGR
jgi:lysophospholipase L1-like esterase